MKFEYDRSVTRGEALALLKEHWQPAPAVCEAPLAEAFGRVLAHDVFAIHSLPIVRSSRCDGIAVRSADFADGLPDTSAWVRGVDFAQADTGDDFPDEFDAVVAVENIEYRGDDGVAITNREIEVKPGSSVNPCGSIIEKGALIAAARTRLSPENVAAIAVGGHASVEVLARPKVAFIPTGSELVPYGTAPQRGQNIEANSLLVSGMLAEWGAEAMCMPIVRDDRDALEAAFDAALAAADIVLINGGSSRGSEDYNSTMIESRSSFFRHGVKAVPGRPVGIALVEGKPVVNVPGPVLAACLCMDWLVGGLVAHYHGTPLLGRQKVRARLGRAVSKPAPFEKLTRVTVAQDESGGLVCEPVSARGIAETLRVSDGLLVSPIGPAQIDAGTEVEVELLRHADVIGIKA